MRIVKIVESIREFEPKFEWAATRSAVRDDMIAHNDTRFEHLAKTFFFRDDQAFDHWCEEIAQASRSKKLKSGKLASYETIMDWIYETDADGFEDRADVDNLLVLFRRKGYPQVGVYSLSNLVAYLHEAHKYLAQQMSVRRLVNSDDLVEHLEKLLRKYPID